ncbi:glucagon receptor isoform X2 [Rousettus aegyptiacus]|uniref:glucagon receptor isoform X2 n=1 Tax=Rousettus aegyptiacus TaxID=9407 RepID=UPI00168D5F8C|nr:glucagon receptor isoform X2 [Rousettus aegyptiacus]
MPPAQPCCPRLLLLLLLLASQPQAPSAQAMDFLFEKWKLYGDQCLHNLSLLPPPTELVCNRTFDKYSCWPDTPPNTTASIPCPWYLPWYHKVQHRLVYKRCEPDGQWARGPRGQPWRNASQCQLEDDEIEVQKEVAKMYSSFQVMYTVGYCLSLGALLLALAILLGLSKLHCTRNYIHVNLFASFVLKASSVLAIDALLKTRYSQKMGDDLSVSVWLSNGYGVVANYCWLLVEGVYLHSLLGPATFSERDFFTYYLGIGWGAPMLFVIPWAVVKSRFENVQCWTSNDNMGFWWILRFPVFLAILAGQVHADPHPPAGGPRGGVRLRDGRARPGHPALGQALLRSVSQLLPGPAGGCSLLFPQQGGAGGAAAALAALAHGPRPAGAPGGQLRGTAPPRPLQREAAALRGQPEPLSAGQPRTTAPEQPRQPCVSQRGGLRAGASLPRPCCAVGGAPRGRGAVGSCPVNARLCPCVSSTIKTEHGGQHTGEWLLRRGCGAEGLPGQGSGRMGPRAGVLPLGAPTSQTAWSWDP